MRSEFRDRLLAGQAEERLLDTLLEQWQAQGLRKSRGHQRTDATRVLAAICTLNRLELVGETLRAALKALAREAPEWLQCVAPLAWYERYSKRIEEARLPREQTQRDAYARTVGEDGFAVLAALENDDAPKGRRDVPLIDTLRRTWRVIMHAATPGRPQRERPPNAWSVSKLNVSCPGRQRAWNRPI